MTRVCIKSANNRAVGVVLKWNLVAIDDLVLKKGNTVLMKALFLETETLCA